MTAITVDSFSGPTSLEQYVRGVSTLPFYDVEEERRLFRLARAGDEIALEAVVSAHLRFVVDLALERRGWGASTEESGDGGDPRTHLTDGSLRLSPAGPGGARSSRVRPIAVGSLASRRFRADRGVRSLRHDVPVPPFTTGSMTSLSETRDDPLARIRQIVREALIEHCAAEHLSVPDFEQRMRSVDHATSEKAILAMLADLPGRSGGGATP